jgi:hypothetical protein
MYYTAICNYSEQFKIKRPFNVNGLPAAREGLGLSA